jgi:hypothetical protein
MFVGVQDCNSRLEAYKAKIRAFSGTGTPPDYTPPIVQQKLGGQSSYQNPAPVPPVAPEPGLLATIPLDT